MDVVLTRVRTPVAHAVCISRLKECPRYLQRPQLMPLLLLLLRANAAVAVACQCCCFCCVPMLLLLLRANAAVAVAVAS
jgi:hypothetical protein